MLVLLNGGNNHHRPHWGGHVPLADACVTEWRGVKLVSRGAASLVPLADACVTEWRQNKEGLVQHFKKCHSLMLVLLNGGR